MAVLIVVATLVLIGVRLIPIGAVVISLPFIYMLARKPVIRRLAVRNLARRPREAVLIILGALLGTAIITSSYVVGDSLKSSIHRSVYTQLGPVDEVVLSNGPAAGAAVEAAVAGANIKGTDGMLPMASLTAAVSTAVPHPVAEPNAQILETDFARARTFGGNPAATGISGPTPTGDEAVIGADLARLLGVRPGDQVIVYAYGTPSTFRVVRTLPRLGVAGLAPITRQSGSDSNNLFIAPGTLNALHQQTADPSRVAPPVSILAISNTGSVTGGLAGTAEVHAQLEASLHGLPAQIIDVKKQLNDAANQAGKAFTQLFQTFGYFSVAVGVLLLVNIFVMLAQERKQSLGMLRAVGLRRASLVGSFSLEGWIYAALAALSGALVGIGVGSLVITAASRIFNNGSSRDHFDLHFAASARSLQAGFLLGFLISLVTVLLTSLYVARLNVIRAIRDLPEPPHEGRRLSVQIGGSLLTFGGGLMTIGGLAASNAILALLGPALLGAGLAMLLLGRVPTRPLISVISAVIIVWSIVSFSVLHHAFQKAGTSVFVVQGLVLNIYAVLLVTVNQQAIGATVRAIGGGARNMSLRLGLAYPLAKRFRTGLLLAMFAIVVFVLVLFTTVSRLFGGQLNDQIRKVGGNAALVVDSNASAPVPSEGIARLPGVTTVAATAGVDAQARSGDSGDFVNYTVIGYGADFIGHGSPSLHSWANQYATQEDAYRAALNDPTKIVVGRDFGGRDFGRGRQQAGLGDVAEVRDPVTGAVRRLTIIGLVDQANYNRVQHVYTSRALTDQLFGSRSTSNLLFVSTQPGTDNDKLASSINGTYVSNGADANSFRHLVKEQFTAQTEFLTLIQGYVGLGLLVGIAGLGVVMVRAVRERRREVGVLRSLGFPGVAVRRAFMTESSFIALEGIVLGTVLALITAWRLTSSSAFGGGVHFSVPWGPVILLVAVTFIASLIATAAPAIQASRIRPAVALRIAD